MKAWQMTGTGQPLQRNEVPVPTVRPGTVLVTVKAAGLCHSDVSSLTDPGWSAMYPELPRTLGHETAGVIEAVGEGMEHWKVGDRVGLAPVIDGALGEALGYRSWDGGWADKILVVEENLVRLPDEVPFDLGAMATDAGLTSYHAMMAVGGCKAGMKVGVIGMGGLGYIGARSAVLVGAEVYAADVNPATRALADEVGLAGVAESITAFADKQLDLIVDYAGFGTTTAEAIDTVGNFGVVVQVGMGKGQATINTTPLILKQVQLRGSMSGTKEDLVGIYELMRSGKLNPPINHITFDEIPESLEQLHKGGVVGRFIAMFD